MQDNKIYYIYHLKGKKIGCTSNINRRIKEQKWNDYEILEQHTDIMIASNRELELQRQYGYPVDSQPFYVVYNNITNFQAQANRKANTDYSNRKIDYSNRKDNSSYTLSHWHTPEIISKRAKSNKKPVLQYDLKGNFIKEWNGAIDAAKSLNISAGIINHNLKGRMKTAKGFIFKYKTN